jgi:membrane protease subunit (stomatin/prohibitin family)
MPLVRRGPGLIGTAARAGVAMGVAGRVQHRQQMRWAEQGELPYQQQAAAPVEAAPAPAAPAQPDYAAQLEQLAQLRDQGVITAEDFEAKKKQILGI